MRRVRVRRIRVRTSKSVREEKSESSLKRRVGGQVLDLDLPRGGRKRVKKRQKRDERWVEQRDGKRVRGVIRVQMVHPSACKVARVCGANPTDLYPSHARTPGLTCTNENPSALPQACPRPNMQPPQSRTLSDPPPPQTTCSPPSPGPLVGTMITPCLRCCQTNSRKNRSVLWFVQNAKKKINALSHHIACVPPPLQLPPQVRNEMN